MEITSEEIKKLISDHNTAKMTEGVNYYKSNSEIRKRKMVYFDKNGNQNEDSTKENHRLVNNWHKLLVDQKVSYLVGKPMVFNISEQEYAEKINLILGEEWHDVIADIAANASNKGKEWLHVYVDKKGYFKYIISPAEEVIPIYDDLGKENLEAVLWYYPITVDDVEIYRAEFWTRDNVSFFIEADGEFVPDESEGKNPNAHYMKSGTGYGWGKVPFIEFPNNSTRSGDLDVIKTLVDEYDTNISDFANNLAEIQELILILKGYEGTNLAEFKHNLRYFKTIKTRGGSDNGVDKLELSIPVEAKKEMLDRLESNIFMFGQGVNIQLDKFGSAPSGESLKFHYTLLDLKASVMERKFRKSIKRLLWFATEYINMKFNHQFDYTTVKTVFRKNRVQGDKELVAMCKDSRDVVSDETILSHHPMVEDVPMELERLALQQKKNNVKVNLGDVDLYEQ